jgi:hypothetical protein
MTRGLKIIRLRSLKHNSAIILQMILRIGLMIQMNNILLLKLKNHLINVNTILEHKLNQLTMMKKSSKMNMQKKNIWIYYNNNNKK